MRADLIYTALLVLMLIPLRGVILQDLWSWFIVPLGVAELGVGQAIGSIALFSLLTPDLPNVYGRSFATATIGEKSKAFYVHQVPVSSRTVLLTRSVSEVIRSLFVWLFGGVIHLCT